ncbi:uncharacterized protein LOC106641234 isoform X1 [Copidosoma floridanum]|uniref:uncharacterized protein LOC106641234 isoform X1 n=1 Tax=Copidosoma floridanum TaxID=29053 RepID=UPI0006C95504|nr:uncharacterized protein LOC106641234 isoform X1 [Copidosoma floridanum]
MPNVNASDRLSLASPLGNTSTLIISGRGTSTPICSPDRSFLRISQPRFVDYTRKIKLEYHPDLDNTSEPIFGLVNLQSLSDIIRREEQAKKENAIVKFSDQLDKGSSDPDVTRIGKNKDERSDSPSARKTNASSRRRSRKSSIYSKVHGQTQKLVVGSSYVHSIIHQQPKRRSDRLDSKKPGLTLVPKCPKSPKLLTAMREKLRQNRERIRKENQKLGIAGDKHLPQQPKREKNLARFAAISKNKYTKCNAYPVTRTENSKKRNESLDNHNKRGAADNRIKPFKAQPIRKYVPLPVARSRSITIPQSPKLGRRRTHNLAC